FDSVGALVTSGDRSRNGHFMAVEYNGDIYVTDLVKGTTRRLTRTIAREHDPVFASDANRVFFIRDDNVYSLDLNDGWVEQLIDLRQVPERQEPQKATGQRRRREQQKSELVAAMRGEALVESVSEAAHLAGASL